MERSNALAQIMESDSGESRSRSSRQSSLSRVSSFSLEWLKEYLSKEPQSDNGSRSGHELVAGNHHSDSDNDSFQDIEAQYSSESDERALRRQSSDWSFLSSGSRNEYREWLERTYESDNGSRSGYESVVSRREGDSNDESFKDIEAQYSSESDARYHRRRSSDQSFLSRTTTSSIRAAMQKFFKKRQSDNGSISSYRSEVKDPQPDSQDHSVEDLGKQSSGISSDSEDHRIQ